MNIFRMDHVLKRMDNMIENAINGNEVETAFDESKMSAIESKLKRYLNITSTKSKQVQKEKDALKSIISDISHQTKTPIANLILYTSLLAENDKLPRECNDLVQQIIAQSEKLNFLVHSLIETSRLETGVILVTPQKNEIFKLINEVIGQIAPKASEKQIDIVIKENEEIAYFDLKWTVEAVYNIIDNAVKYSNNCSSIEISVTAYEMFCRIDICDHGIGISEEEQSKIFTRFYRSTAVSQEEGLGIGLYLARTIVSKQGGYIKVSSKPGNGAIFSVFLPK